MKEAIILRESKEAINKYVGCVDNDTHFHTWKEEYVPNEYIKMFSIKILNKKKVRDRRCSKSGVRI